VSEGALRKFPRSGTPALAGCHSASALDAKIA